MVKLNVSIILCVLIVLKGTNLLAQKTSIDAQPDQYRAIYWTKEHGLTGGLNEVTIKDIKGFLWVGGELDELSRFDGATFKKYHPNANKPGAINSGSILAFVEDSLHNIWIGTAKGVSRYDIKADTFTNFVTHPNSNEINQSVFPFWATSNEVFCLESQLRVVAYNIHTLKSKLLLTFTKSDRTFPTSYAVFDSTTNSLWFQENTHDSQYAGLLQIDLDDGTKQHFTWDCYRKNLKHNHQSEAIQYDCKRNSIWLNTGDGLLEFSLSDKQFHRVEALRAFENLKGYDRYVGIDIDKDGKIWFATQPRGILIYDPKTDQARELFSDPVLQQRTGAINRHIYCDRDGISWISYWYNFGMYEILPSNALFARYNAKPNLRDSLSNSTILSIIPGPGGKIWIGTEDGLNIFDPETEKFEVLRPKDLPGLKGQTIIPLYIDTIHQRAWLCTRSFLESDLRIVSPIDMYEMDVRTRKCQPVRFQDSIKPTDIFSIVPAWAIPYKGGLLLEEDLHGVFEINDNGSDLVIPFKEQVAISQVVLKENKFLFLKNWAQKEVYPLNFTFENQNGEWVRIAHPLDSLKWVNFLYSERDQAYWVSFENELVRYNKDFKKIKSYGEEDGYVARAISILQDNKGNIWFNTNLNQLCRLNPPTGIITTMSQADGFQKQTYDWYSPAVRDAKSNLYFGGTSSRDGIGGLDRILPDKYASVITSSVYLRSLAINKKPFSGPFGPNNVEELSLPYNQNTISVETGIIDFYAKGNGHIRYKLERNGREENWQYGPAYYAIRYESLSPGSYRLVMQATNPNEEFNSPEKILMIHISLPFWETWWFRIFALIFLVDLIYTIVRWRLRQKFNLQLERSEKETQMAGMRQNTAELLQQKTEMEMQALRAQMNPHFIFNSLNSINRFILKNDRTQASEYLTKFSKLVRMILQNSQASLISLETELEALGLYLEMEALRFNYHFDYKITTSKDLDIEVLQVPPLILQPYVENAIWHGLMHKEEKGHLCIDVAEKDDQLHFSIRDDGIGRAKARELASKTATKHKSMGLRITANRIAILKKNTSQESPVAIYDHVNDDGTATGTEVIIKMPLIYD